MEPNRELDSKEQAFLIGPYLVLSLYKHYLSLNLPRFFASLLLSALPFPHLHLPHPLCSVSPSLLLFPSPLFLKSLRYSPN